MAMFTHILCPVDFSKESQRALGYAIALGRRCRCSVTGLHVYPVPVFPEVSGYPTFMPSPPDVESLQAGLRAFLPAPEAAGMPIEILVEGGDPARTIIERAQALSADLVVMGTHGLSGFERFALGSVTEKVLRKAAPPVLTVPPAASPAADVPFTRLLCAVDFSPSSLGGLRYAVSLARNAGARLVIVHVLETRPDERAVLGQPLSVAEYWRERESDARRQLAALVPADLPTGAETLLRHGKPYAEILAVAVESQSDLIVLGIHGRTALDVAILGSTTNQIVRRASCPVLTVRLT
jgi:nucleotide-binding universal stress UspA family protein